VTITIRLEAAADAQAVRALLAGAFETSVEGEAELVEQLRRDGDLVLALVAVDAVQRVVGYVAFPRLYVENADREFPAVGLAPLAVVAPHRRQGVGAALVRAGLDRLAARGETIVFVLGNPDYYTRFGFALDLAQPFICVYAGPYFMALCLADTAPRAGIVRYPAAFDGLG
jgi:putative acetyltransferase